MSTLFAFARFEIGAFMFGMMAIVLYRMLTREINIRGLLSGKHGSKALSVERIQLLAITMVSALYYLLQVIEHPTQLPPMPRELVLVLGGSNVVYLGGKTYAALLDPLLVSIRKRQQGGSS